MLSPDLLNVLCGMGRGDEIVLADADFNAEWLAGGKPVQRSPGAGMREARVAVLSVLPLDGFVRQPVAEMQLADTAAEYRGALQREVLGDLVARGGARAEQCETTEHLRAYERLRGAYAIVQTGEMKTWANLLFKKGVVAVEARR